MFKNKRLFVSLIIVLAVVSLAGVITLVIKSFDKGTPQVPVLNPSGAITSPTPVETEETAAVFTPTPSVFSAAPVSSEGIDQAIDIYKFSSLIRNSYNSSISGKMAEDLKDTINEYSHPGYRITSFSIADVNNDNKDELVLTYFYPYDDTIDEWEYRFKYTKVYEEQSNYLCVYGFDSGTLIMLDRAEIPVISTAVITDLIPDNKKEIFVIDKHMDEYPAYSMYMFNDNKLDMIDLESIGLNPQAQFVSVDYDTIYMGNRITGGVYGGDTLKWENGSFISIEHHYTDNRLLYKTQTRESFTSDISSLYKYDEKLPVLKDNEVTVENPYQLLSLIGPNRTIYLKPGIYDLGYAASVRNKYVSTHREGTNISEFSINGVENLKIIGLGEERVEIALLNAESSVLKISRSSNVSFENIMMGHGMETYGCVEEVLGIEDSSGISIKNCSFYGCGAYGIVAQGVTQMNVNDSVIEECSIGGVVIDSCKDINFNNINFSNNSADVLIRVDNSQNVVFDGVQDNQNHYVVFEKNNNSTLEIKNVKKQ